MDNLRVKANNICLHPQYPVIQKVRTSGEGVKDFCTLYCRVYAHARACIIFRKPLRCEALSIYFLIFVQEKIFTPDLLYKNYSMMKKILFSLLLSFIALSAVAQSQKFYCEIHAVEQNVPTGFEFFFDFGSNNIYSRWGGLSEKQQLVDEDGRYIKFKSMVGAGNYLAERGWTFLQAYTSVYKGLNLLHWVFCKEAETPEEAYRGLITKEEYKNRTK